MVTRALDEVQRLGVPAEWVQRVDGVFLGALEGDAASSIGKGRAYIEFAAYRGDDGMPRLQYEDQSAEDAVATVELLRRQVTRILKKMPAGAFDRKGKHNQAGDQTAREVIDKCTWHLNHHMKFIQEKRKALGLSVS